MKRVIILAVASLSGFAVAAALAAPPRRAAGPRHARLRPHAALTTTTATTDTSTTDATSTDTTGTQTTTAPSNGRLHEGRKPPRTGAGCRPRIAVVLRGTLAADGAAAPSKVALTVIRGNRPARAYKAATQPVTIAVTAATRVNRRGDHNPADLKQGDRANVLTRVCRADLAGGATPPLTAFRIVARPPKSSGGAGPTTTGTTTTGTTTTDTTTTDTTTTTTTTSP